MDDNKAGWKVLERAKSKRQTEPRTKKKSEDERLLQCGTMSKKQPWDIPEQQAFINKEVLGLSRHYRQEFEAAFRAYRETIPPNMAGHPDCDLIECFNLSNEAKTLCDRWGLAFALHPDDELWESSHSDASVFFKDMCRAVKVIPQQKSNRLKDDRYLRVEIDLLVGKGQIEAELDRLIDNHQEFIITKEVRKLLESPHESIFPPHDLPVEQWIAERNKQEAQQETQRIAEIRKQIEKDNAFRRRRKSLDISF